MGSAPYLRQEKLPISSVQHKGSESCQLPGLLSSLDTGLQSMLHLGLPSSLHNGLPTLSAPLTLGSTARVTNALSVVEVRNHCCEGVNVGL
jgi:hypothetical protein